MLAKRILLAFIVSLTWAAVLGNALPTGRIDRIDLRVEGMT